jgi:integrase
MARFALATGLRQANVTGLRWADVDLERRTAWAWPHETKNRKRYSIPLNADALAVLAECQGMHDERVFVYANHTHKKPKPAVPIAQPTGPAWYKAVERAGLKGLRWHDLRHTWASWHVMAGTRLEVLQQLGGWSDFKMVLRYAHLSTSYVAAFAGNSEIRVKISSNVNVSGSDVIQFPMQKQGVADGTRTHNTRNHNPGETSE